MPLKLKPQFEHVSNSNENKYPAITDNPDSH